MLDHAFQRREIERMLLSGKRLTVPKLMAMYSVGKNAIRRDFEVIGEELPVIAKQGYNGGYSLMDGAGKYQNSLSREQLECLEKLAVGCTGKDRETVLSSSSPRLLRSCVPSIITCQYFPLILASSNALPRISLSHSRQIISCRPSGSGFSR